MSFLNLTSGIKQIQNLLGIDGWNLSTCSYTPTNTKFKSSSGLSGNTQDQVVTFLDMEGTLSSAGINLDLSAIPLAQTLASAINDPSSLPFANKSFDKSGDTLYIKQMDQFKNQLMIYRLPNNQPLIQFWGSEVTTFKVTTILSGDRYLDKLRYLQQILTQDTGEQGGTLNHPLYGIMYGVFVDQFSVLSTASPFNASIVEITFITADNFVPIIPTATATTINTLVNNAINTLTIIGSVGTISDQLKSLYPSAYFPDSFFGGSSNEFIQVQRESDTKYKAQTTNLQADSPNLASAVQQFNAKGIPLDYDTVLETQKMIEQCMQYRGTVVQGYGQGGLGTSTVKTINTVNPDAYKNTESTSVDGVVTKIEYQVTGENSDGTSIVTETTTIIKPVAKPNNISILKSQIDILINVAGVMTKLYSYLYYHFTTLISYLEQLVDVVFKSGNIRDFLLDEDMLPMQVASRFNMDISEFFQLNSNLLIGHRKLRKGMTVTVESK